MTENEIPISHCWVSGLLLPGFITHRQMNELNHFCPRPDDVFVVTYPKSGTTWVQHIVNLIRSGGKDDGTKISDAVPWLELEGMTLQSGVKVDEMVSPRTFKSHLPYSWMPGGPPHTSPAKYIYIARNPKDVAVSAYYHYRRFKVLNFNGTWDQFYNLFVHGQVMYGLWFEHVLEWWKHKDVSNILFLKYEDLKKDLPGMINDMAKFLGYDLSSADSERIVNETRFESMKVNPATNYSWFDRFTKPDNPPFIRKGTVGDWRNHFTAKQNADFNAIYAEKMEGTHLNFDHGTASKL